MKRNRLWLYFTLMAISLAVLSCSLFTRAVSGGDKLSPTGSQTLIRQWASTARAGSEYSNPDWSAQQATGAPDTLECGDRPTAWAAYNQFDVEWLEVGFDVPVAPTEINIYESHTPTQIVRVEVLDSQGIYHEIYIAEPKMAESCPYILSVPVQSADYQAVGVKITVDQSQLGLPWDEIDAVELVGYASNMVAGTGQETEAQQPDSQPAPALGEDPGDGPLIELPVANPSQAPSFNISYSGCNEDGQEQGTDVEASVHDDRIDLRLKGTNGKYALITLPRNLEDNFSDQLVPFVLEGRVPSAAGLYIRSVWWYGERGQVSTHYNDDNTLSGQVEFEGTRKQGCDFKVNAEFDHIVLR